MLTYKNIDEKKKEILIWNNSRYNDNKNDITNWTSCKKIEKRIRYFSRGREVTWEEMGRILDRRDAIFWSRNAAFGGGKASLQSNGWVLVDKVGVDGVRRIVVFLC